MFALILSLLLVAQGATRPPADTGTITGVIKTTSGTPAAGVRVTAQARPESPGDVLSSASFASLAETDQSGRYRLENIPPGDYFVGAGRMGSQTFYPGTEEMLKGKAVTVKASALISEIDFALDDSSIRLPDNDVTPILGAISGLTLPVQVRMEGDAKQPIFSDNRKVTLRLTLMQDQARSEMPLTEAIQNFAIPDPMPGNEYRISVENLPKGYVVKSIFQDGVDLLIGTLKLTTKSFAPAPVSVRDLTAPGGYKDPGQFKSNAGMPMTPIEITLAAAPGTAAAGLTLSGHVTASVTRFLSPTGLSGILFADGTFEFHGVSQGRHVILFQQEKPGSPTRTFAVAVVMGNRDLRDVIADETPVVPAQIQVPARTPPPGVIPLASLRGSVVDESSKEPVFGGHVRIAGQSRAELPIDSLGLFEIPRLLPGNYDLIIDGFQHATVLRSVTIGDEDVQLNVSAKASN